MPHADRDERNEYARKWYARNREAHGERVREVARRKRQQVLEYLNSLKSQPCVDCGQSFDPEAMDFDHVHGEKLFNVSIAGSYGYSLKKIEVEVAKCEVVCAVCHRLRTKARRLAKTEK
jgi:hypothetical protein